MAKKIVSRKRPTPGEPPEAADVTPLPAESPEAVPESEPGNAALPSAAPILESAASEPAWAQLPKLTLPSVLEKEWQAFAIVGVASALIGALFALLILAAINRGTLSLNQREEVAVLTSRADELASRADAVETESESLRARLAALEGLTARVDAAEAALADMSAALDSAQADLAALNTRADQLAADIEKVRAASERFDSFLTGLRDLLAEIETTPTPQP